MKPEDWDVLQNYVQSIRNQLGLRDWYLVIKHQPPENTAALASVFPIEGRRFATLRVCAEFRELTATEQRQAIVHELIHCHLGEIQHYLSNILPKALGSVADTILEANRLKIEYAVDAIAQEWAEAFPMIPWVTDDPRKDEMVGVPYEGAVDQGIDT